MQDAEPLRLPRSANFESCGTGWMVSAIDLSLNGKLLASGQPVVVWDFDNRSRYIDFNGLAHSVLCVRFSPDGRFLVATGANQMIFVWDVSTGEVVYNRRRGTRPETESPCFLGVWGPILDVSARYPSYQLCTTYDSQVLYHVMKFDMRSMCYTLDSDAMQFPPSGLQRKHICGMVNGDFLITGSHPLAMVLLGFDPGSCPDGSRVNLVVIPVALDPMQMQHLVRDSVKGFFCRVNGHLSENAASYALLGAVVHVSGNVPNLTVDHQTFVIPHSIPDWAGLQEVIEVCAGSGYMGIGTSAVGILPITGCDFNEVFVKEYARLHEREIIHGDICKEETVMAIWAKCKNLAGLIAGVSCQPYSTLGDQRSGDDERSSSLTGALHAIHWLRCPYGILECVPPIATDPFAQKELDDFCQGTGYSKKEIILDLVDIWPTRRRRWWCILTAQAFGQIQIPDFPSMFGLSKIAQLIPSPMPMTESEMLQLELNEREQEAFGTNGESCDYFMNSQGVLPCALHAWGSQMQGCPCGCRRCALSESRLRERGLHGVVLPTDNGKGRHIHPAELALLNGVDPGLDFEPLKLSLCSLGQLASPLPSLWISSHVKKHLEKMKSGESETNPYKELAAYASWLVARAQMIWEPTVIPGELAELVKGWAPLKTLSMEQLFALDFWEPRNAHMSFARILDQVLNAEPDTALFRFIQREKETLGIDQVQPTVPATIPATVAFVIDDGPPCKKLRITTDHDEGEYEVTVSSGTTIDQLTQADDKLRRNDRPSRAFFQGCVLSPGDSAYAYDVLHVESPNATPVDSEVSDGNGETEDSGDASRPDSDRHPGTDDVAGNGLHGESGPLPLLMPEGVAGDEVPDEPVDGESMAPTTEADSVPADDGVALAGGVAGERNGESGQLPVLMPEGAVAGEVSSGESGQLPCLMPDDGLHGESRPLPFLMPGCRTGDGTGDGGTHAVRVSVSHLKQLDAESLLRLGGPVVTTVGPLEGLLSQAIPVEERKEVLQNQHLLWADDEIRWHLARLQQHFHEGVKNRKAGISRKFRHVAFVDPLIVRGWLACGNHDVHNWCSTFCRDGVDCVMMVAPVGGHWVPLFLWVENQQLQVHTWDAQDADHVPLWPVLCAFATILGSTGTPQIQRDHRMFIHQGRCGALAIAFLMHKLFSWRLPVVDSEAAFFHNKFREMFLDALGSFATCARPWIWAAGPHAHAEQQLKLLLEEKGVPPEVSDKRVSAAMNAIGAKGITQAFSFKDPWRQLKSLGNQARFQFLLPTELQSKIDANGGNRRPPKKKTPQIAPKPQLTLDPSKLQVPQGTFSFDGAPLNRLELSQIGPIAEGYVLTTLVEAEAYLRANQVVSKCPLALVIVSGLPKTFPTSLAQTSITLPCRCSVDNEPILLDVTVVQIGQGFVEKSVEKTLVSVATVEVATLKLMIYKDEVEDWSLIAQAPLKYVCSQFPLLVLCEAANCGCPKWHNPNRLNMKSAMLDVWRRQYLRPGFRPEPAATAEIFTVCVRVPNELLLPLLQCSGKGGIYCEPRSDDGKDIAGGFSIVWMPKITKAEMLRQKQLNPEIIGLARTGDRRGLRTKSCDAANIHSRIRPDSVYLAGGQRLQFIVGPLPYGSDRASICKALQTFGWDTKPIQPVSSQPGKGAMWVIHALTEPPQNLLKMGHGDVVVTKHKHLEKDKTESSHPVAAPATLALCGATNADKGTKVDPWVNGGTDPWQRPMAVDAAPPSESLKRIESQLEQAVLAKIPDVQSTQDRLQNLEVQMQTMMTKHVTLETQVREADARQQHRLSSLESQLHSQGNQLQGSIESQKQDISAMFQTQMQQIRSLIQKRSREDSEDDTMS
eukprot:Skav232070  [mRNA]  locus=scaffold1176:172271:201562:- [translate_table: standard]